MGLGIGLDLKLGFRVKVRVWGGFVAVSAGGVIGYGCRGLIIFSLVFIIVIGGFWRLGRDTNTFCVDVGDKAVVSGPVVIVVVTALLFLFDFVPTEAEGCEVFVRFHALFLLICGLCTSMTLVPAVLNPICRTVFAPYP